MYNMALQGLEVALTSWYWGKTQTNNSCTHLQPQTLSQEKVVTRWRWSEKSSLNLFYKQGFSTIHPSIPPSIHPFTPSIHPSIHFITRRWWSLNRVTLTLLWRRIPRWIYLLHPSTQSIHSTHPLHPSSLSTLLGIFPKIHPFWESGASLTCNFKDWLWRLDSIHNSCDVFLLLLAIKVISILIPDV